MLRDGSQSLWIRPRASRYAVSAGHLTLSLKESTIDPDHSALGLLLCVTGIAQVCSPESNLLSQRSKNFLWRNQYKSRH